MSTPTSKAALVVSLCLSLAACGGGVGIGAGGSGSSAQREVAVTSDQIRVSGPEGFCVDPTATRDRGETGFVLLGNCAAITNSRRAGQPDVPAVLTAAISAPGAGGEISGNLSGLDAFFRSEEGLRLLSRSQEASSVTILDTAVEGEVFYLHASDTSTGPIHGVQQEYWRAYMDIGFRIATLSVLGLEDRELSEVQSRSTLREFVQAVQWANSGPADEDPFVAPPPPVAPAPPPQTSPARPLWNVGLFRRILG